MPEIASRQFAALFQQALAKGGKLAAADVQALERASAQINKAHEKQAADGLLALLKHDREFDAFEVAPAKKALGVLLGVSSGRLPADLERVLTHAVPAANVKVKHYDLSFDFSKDGASFPARAVVTLERAAKGESILEVDPERLSISAVTVGGRAVPFTVKDGRLHVDAPGAKALDISYRVKPQDVRGNADTAYGLIRDKYADRMWTLTWPYNTGALFPSNSHPSDGATAKVTLKVEAGHTAYASGNPTSASTFEMKAQAPAYSVAVYSSPGFKHEHAGHANNGVEVSGLGLENAIPPATREAYRKAAISAVDFFTGWLGQYDYGNTLALVELPGGLGGMEHTSAVAIMLGNARSPELARETAVHETAHHWFGDNIRIASWGDFWMSEGFTNYATYRFFGATEGEAKFQQLLTRAKADVRATLADNPHALSADAHTDVNEIFDDVPYEMGPWILRMLEVKVGRPAFDALLKDWFHANRQKAVSTQDFVKFAKQKTGQDFSSFFKEWNSITSVPQLDGDVKLSGNKATVTLKAPAGTPAGLEVPLKLEGEGGKSKVVTVKPGQPVEVDAGFPVKRFTWDPDVTVLADVR
ncbi:MAG: M1 family aminopeptidase [Myxococcota bacterium]